LFQNAPVALFTDAKFMILIRDFIKGDIFIVVFTSSRSNDHDEKIYTLIGPLFTGSTNRVKKFLFVKETKDNSLNIRFFNINIWLLLTKSLQNLLVEERKQSVLKI
jgi:hypothetical protein